MRCDVQQATVRNYFIAELESCEGQLVTDTDEEEQCVTVVTRNMTLTLRQKKEYWPNGMIFSF